MIKTWKKKSTLSLKNIPLKWNKHQPYCIISNYISYVLAAHNMILWLHYSIHSLGILKLCWFQIIKIILFFLSFQVRDTRSSFITEVIVQDSRQYLCSFHKQVSDLFMICQAIYVIKFRVKEKKENQFHPWVFEFNFEIGNVLRIRERSFSRI